MIIVIIIPILGEKRSFWGFYVLVLASFQPKIRCAAKKRKIYKTITVFHRLEALTAFHRRKPNK